jgi:predicted nuclease of predicted toxin-antitoxin system
MRFLVDECTGPKVAQWLRDQGFEVCSVYEKMRGVSDDEIIRKACSENWIVITNDKDFGEKAFKEGHPHKGIIFLRLDDERSRIKIAVLSHFLNNYQSQIQNNFIVVSETKVRFARKYINDNN